MDITSYMKTRMVNPDGTLRPATQIERILLQRGVDHQFVEKMAREMVPTSRYSDELRRATPNEQILLDAGVDPWDVEKLAKTPEVVAACLTVSAGKNRRPTVQEPEEKPTVALSLDGLEAANCETEGLEEVVEGFFPRRSVNLLAGDSGLGKSPLVCQLAVCVASGKPFLGNAVKQGVVLIADYENDAALAPMLRAVSKAVGAEVDNHLSILQRPSQKAVIKAAKRWEPALVIVDSLRGFDPNAESKADTSGGLISRLQEVDTCWLLIHHLRKQNAESPRADLNDTETPVMTWLENVSGSRALVNQSFTRIAVDGSREKAADLVLRGYFKGRGEFGPYHLERMYDPETDLPMGYARLVGENLLNLNQKADLQRLKAQGRPLSRGEIVELLGGAKSKAHRLIGVCRNLRLVKEEGREGQADRRYVFL